MRADALSAEARVCLYGADAPRAEASPHPLDPHPGRGLPGGRPPEKGGRSGGVGAIAPPPDNERSEAEGGRRFLKPA